MDPGATVTLDGSGSSDPNGDALTYYWVQTGGEAVTFTPDLMITTFTAPSSAGPLTFALTVTDPGGLSDADSTVVTVRDLGPTAEAGPDQQVDPGAAVTLDGSASSDPNGDALTYYWVQTGGEPVTFTPDLMITTFTAPSGAGPLTFALTVTDPDGLSDADSTVVTVRNLAPAAEAGPDQQVDPGATVTLDGSASSDPNGDALTYYWVQTGGEAVTFTPDLMITTFTAPPSAGPLTFALTVTDPGGLSNADSTVVTLRNLAPTAEAGPDQQVDPGATVTLDGSASSDPNGDTLTYYWVQTGGAPVTFAPDLRITTFTAPLAAGPLTFALTVTDSGGLADGDVTVVTVRNLAPTAEAGPNQKVRGGVTVTLDGSASSDPNGDALTYRWRQIRGIPVIFNPNLRITTFTAPPVWTRLGFTLRVTDGGKLSHTDTVFVTVGPFPGAEAGPDQQVVPGATVTLDARASSNPDGGPLSYRWVQVGGLQVDFSPVLSVTTVVAPSGPLTFTLIVTSTAGLTDTDTILITGTPVRIYLPLLLNGGPQAQVAPDQGVTSVFAGSNLAGRVQETMALDLWRPIWPSGWRYTSPRSWADAYQQVLGFPLRRVASAGPLDGGGRTVVCRREAG